ncbi:cell adhesion molecule 1 [Mytilus galloprovincialis]|uniref:Cell adhesion molecule 1 n=1 Tax=Mytilus galloprovincialis TaxID=29158 RepID=A0A8B6DZI2_MYTGA|nr:cell adhesion molecule 1 [Mytilus galloprovincialis]
MEWFGPAYSNISFNQSLVNDMHEKRSFWTMNRYTEGKSISPSLPNHNRLKVIRRPQTGEYELQIRNASLLEEGLYFCDDSEMLTASDYYILQLINRTVVSSMHDKFEEINEGETKKFCCYLDSNQTKTSLRWLKGNKTVLVTQNGNVSCYTIMSVTRHDQEVYTCLAENIIESGSVTVVLKVKYKPEISVKQAMKEIATEGDTKKLCCCIESYPSPTITRWLKGSQEIMVAYNVTDVCYTINNISRYDQGVYTCTAENIVGGGSNTTVIKVKCKF